MRKTIGYNQGWRFAKDVSEVPKTLPDGWEKVNLPHTWNAEDGQDGGNDYFRGSCCYAKLLKRDELPKFGRCYLEIKGANSSADVYLNGEKLMHHDGGYSTWRVDLTEHLKDENLLAVLVDNSPNDRVYPQVADFTFYGGLYRDVNIICVSETHFALDYFGTPGIKVTPKLSGKDADVEIEVFVTNPKSDISVAYTIFDSESRAVASTDSKELKAELCIENVRRWHGRRDPYLYTAKAELLENGKVIDCVSTRFGCREFKIDPDKGFILNGEMYPLRGVSRHQDRLGIGNALLPEHHKEDIDLIMEVGATTVRLAHYQHDQYFYDLCDENGLVVWAEIPYISHHMPTGRENTISQMKELVTQNYNHPSIVVWGLSNEITMKGDKDPDLLENHRILNDLVHKMDKTRLTTVAAVSPCPIDSEYLRIPDVVSYNHYFGWYGGDTSMNGPWFDKFHETNPDIPIGCSEYGCEALNWHSSEPEQGDYTEEYQAYYHEELIKQLYTRPYLWATHVWNMFDFGADARSEGGENGQNHKGLVTMDRKYKKDAFYAYKAWLSDEKFVHICSKRYVDRVELFTTVTVYSNMPEVQLFANGDSLGKKKSNNHFFKFTVPILEIAHIEAVAGDCRDEAFIRKVDKFNEKYRLVEKNAVINWFDIDMPQGYFSINDKIDQIMKTEKGRSVLMNLLENKMPKDKKAAGFEFDMKDESMMSMMGGFTVLRLSSMMSMMNVSFTKEELLELNRELNSIEKPKK